jgi:hypothetical protein
MKTRSAHVGGGEPVFPISGNHVSFRAAVRNLIVDFRRGDTTRSLVPWDDTTRDDSTMRYRSNRVSKPP